MYDRAHTHTTHIHRQENQAEALKNVASKLPTVYYNNSKWVECEFGLIR